MGKPKRTIYVYQDGDFLKKCESMHSASKMTRDTMGCIDNILKKSPHWSKRGYFYSYTELRSDQLPDFTEPKIRIIPRDKDLDYDDDDDEFYITKSKRKVKENLRQFINVHMQQHWMEVPKTVAQMERRYISALLAQL